MLNINTNMESPIKQRLVEFIKFKNLSYSKFERMINAGNGFVNNLSKGLGAEKLSQISAVFPEIDTQWLITGEGNMIKAHIIQKNQSGDNINGQSVTVNKTEAEKLLEVISSYQEIIRKKDEQIDRLLEIINSKQQ